MRGAYLVITFICIVAIATTSFLLSRYYREQAATEVRCSSYVRMDLAINASQILLIDAVINFQRNKDGAVMLIKGSVESDKGLTTLSREIILDTANVDELNGYEYTVRHIRPGPTDDTPEAHFNEFLGEISGDDHHVFLNDRVIRDDAVLIGGPYSNLFMCVKY
ncbi:FidL-like protein [Erwinia persicina]|uniref:Uncharacterized protein n=1 Tax=Erwinia persicina TaxID=55211 RepID=A0A4U3F3H1_9GAMM|nr:FidL-like protein [Erwinia persicina]MBC3948129.1 hypothetical protein [Erwinia persicina]MBD8108161.1 hypothetical protein [Erwinia persicina]MBD8211235.1 hypothetical protein [Erwinia persicina]MCQ4095901.1 FidL-like protein [Erwinia persicina]MCQ4102440.1 FidL-like protein [Erwinia persicina]